MPLNWSTIRRWLWVDYQPQTGERGFADRAERQRDKGEPDSGLEVALTVLDAAESRRHFGVPMSRRGIQPVWLRIANSGNKPCRLLVVSIDPSYFTALEAAACCHYSIARRMLSVGALGWLFLPLLLLAPLKLISAQRANRRMDAHFRAQSFRLQPIEPGQASEGFVFTPVDIGTKVVHVRLLIEGGDREFVFEVQVPGIAADYHARDLDQLPAGIQPIDCDLPELAKRVREQPRATSNAKATREGDPVNLVVIGEFPMILGAFGGRWDETEVISMATCWRTFKAFMLGDEYRYSPVSGLHLFGRTQDFALQRIRKSINERLHLRLWLSPLRFNGLPVWIGQVSRDIGVRFTWRTWNLTTHRVDPDVDEARDYVVEDLLEAERIEAAGYIDGVGRCEQTEPRHNLTGDPYFTDGKRAAILLARGRTKPRFLSWS